MIKMITLQKNSLICFLLLITLATTVQSNEFLKGNKKHTGIYVKNIVDTRAVVISDQDGFLYMGSKNKQGFKLINIEGNQYKVDGTPMTVTFTENERGIDEFILDQGSKKKGYIRKSILLDKYKTMAKTIRPNGLSDAVILGDIESAKVLIQKGVDLSELDIRTGFGGNNGRRPINWAAKKNNVEMLQLLIDSGAAINQANKSGYTAMHHAVESGSEEAMILLIQKGAKVDLKNVNGQTPLEIAAIKNNQKMIEIIQNKINLLSQ